jgi:anti-sigma28 factor (negative regulator of flagellin synthesis)
MRIEPTDKSFRVGPASPAHSEATPATRARPGSDHVELSVLSQAAGALSPQRVEEIQSQVSSGTYQVNAAEVSHSIVDFYLIPLK